MEPPRRGPVAKVWRSSSATLRSAPTVFSTNSANSKPGQVAAVSNANDTVKFEVLSVKQDIPKTDGAALSRVLKAHPPTAGLALITCSGHFNGRESVENTVVFLTRVEAR